MGFYLGLMSGTSMDAIHAALVLCVSPPKSTGRELFNLPWLNSKLGLYSRRPEDVQATLQQFTAATVAAAVHRRAPGAALYVCGGGAHNAGREIPQHERY
jgi:1,6-anhydro-N-acetylmuramate kinase